MSTACDCKDLDVLADPPRDAAKATRPRRGPGSSQRGLVKGEASHLSGRQTDYRRKDGRRNNADMGEGGSRLDGQRGERYGSTMTRHPLHGVQRSRRRTAMVVNDISTIWSGCWSRAA